MNYLPHEQAKASKHSRKMHRAARKRHRRRAQAFGQKHKWEEEAGYEWQTDRR